jgi:hypothetical protein
MLLSRRGMTTNELFQKVLTRAPAADAHGPSASRPLAQAVLILLATACGGPAGNAPPPASDGGMGGDVASSMPDAAASADVGGDARLDTGADAGSDVRSDTGPDSPSGDASPDVVLHDGGGGSEGGGGADASVPDSGSDAGTTFLALTGTDSLGNAMGYIYAKDSSGTMSWSAASTLVSRASLGGVTVLPSGQAVAAFIQTTEPDDDTYVASEVWSGGWGAGDWLGEAFGTTPSSMGIPVPSPTGAAVAHLDFEGSTEPSQVMFAEFDPASSTWSTDGPSLPIPSAMVPAVAITSGGDPVLLTALYGNYSWSERSGTTWSTPAAIAGAPPFLLSDIYYYGVSVATQVGGDQILAVFLTGSGLDFSLESATFSSGTWSSPVIFESGFQEYDESAPFSLAALPDGRIALAFAGSAGLEVGFWNGTSWGVFQSVGYDGVTSLSLAPGATGAILDLAFVQGINTIVHARLTDEATWTWSETVVDSFELYSTVSLAEGP